jgi:hypothetical protein
LQVASKLDGNKTSCLQDTSCDAARTGTGHAALATQTKLQESALQDWNFLTISTDIC